MQSDPYSSSPEPHAPAEPGRDTPAGTPGEVGASAVSSELGVPLAPAAPSSNGFPSHAATSVTTDHTPIPKAAEVGVAAGNEAPPAEATAGAAQETEEPLAPPQARYNPFRFWLRPIVLAVLVVILLGLTYWDQQRIADRPLAPDVLLATPPANGAISPSDPALDSTLARLRTALERRDVRAFANLGDPDGIVVAPYGGGIPDTGLTVTDTSRLSQDALNGAHLRLLGWRSDGRGRIIVMADGWPEKPLRLGTTTLDLTSLSGIGLASRGGTWYVRWLMPDANGVLAQQARTIAWQPLP